MRTVTVATSRARVLAALACAVVCAPAQGQLIPIRSVPVAHVDPLAIFPSLADGMGGVSIATDDPLLDPFTSPATGARLEGGRLLSAPAVYRVSRNAGAGRTLPLAALGRVGPWFGGVALGAQQVDPAGPGGEGFVLHSAPLLCDCGPVPLTLPRDVTSASNRYAFATAGRALPSSGLAFGASVLRASLGARDGVDLLYPSSTRLEQSGHALDVRLGALKEWRGGSTLEVVAVHHRLAAAHEALYFDAFWEPGSEQMGQRPRAEQQEDRASTWGLRADLVRPLPGDGWRGGLRATVNRKRHADVPMYERVAFPSDGGRSTALELGLGVARRHDSSTIGVDLIYEPIWSHTWLRGPFQLNQAASVPAGSTAVDHRFRFSNAVLRLGVGDEVELVDPATRAGLQVGLEVRSLRYSLRQRAHLTETLRRHEAQWAEWTPTWALSLRRPSFEIRYQGRSTNGVRRPGITAPPSPCDGTDTCVAPDAPPVRVRAGQTAPAIDVIPSVGGAEREGPMSVTVHQISLSVPLGPRRRSAVAGEPDGGGDAR